MKTLRCLIADIPQKILADIVQSETQQYEKIDVVGQVSDINDISALLQRQKIDVLIVGIREDSSHQFCRDILQKFPQ